MAPCIVSTAPISPTGGRLLVSPLALEQRGNGFVEFIGASGGLAKRSVVLVKQILVGHSLPADRAVAALVAAIVSVSVALLVTRATRAEQRAAAIAATTGGAAVVVPVLLAAVGLDYVNTRNALVGFAPLAVASCAGLALAAPRRASAAALAALFAVLLTITVVVAIDPAYHRPDWRSLAQAIGTPHGPRAVVVAPDHQGWFARVPLRVYLADAHGVDERLVSTPPQFASVSRGVGDHQSPSSLVVDEIVVAAAGWETPALPRVLAQQFRLVEVRSGAGYELRRYRSAHPIRVPTALFSTPLSAVLLEKASP
jgi:hypothetical protein